MTIKTAAVVCLCACLLAGSALGQQAPTLYKRLGGYDAIAAVTDDFLARLSADPQFTKFFAGHSPAKEKDEVLGAVSALKKDIVEKP